MSWFFAICDSNMNGERRKIYTVIYVYYKIQFYVLNVVSREKKMRVSCEHRIVQDY
jgi:hypothetical protein